MGNCDEFRKRVILVLYVVSATLLIAICVVGILGATYRPEQPITSSRITLTVHEVEEKEDSVDIEDPDEGAKIYAAILAKCQVVKDCYIVGYAPELVEGWRPENRNKNGLYMTASGMWAMPGYCVATDPEVIPTGATVIIGGRVYVAADLGVKGKVVDIMMTPEEALVYGCHVEDVYWCMEGGQ